MAVLILPKGSGFMGTDDGPVQSKIKHRSRSLLNSQYLQSRYRGSESVEPELSAKTIYVYYTDKMSNRPHVISRCTECVQAP